MLDNLVKRCDITTMMSTKTCTTGEAAKQIGVSRQTLQAWIAAGKISAPKPVELGNVPVRLWTKASIEKARKFKGTLKPGPRSKRKN
jgi:excisionase family DNA binding protein